MSVLKDSDKSQIQQMLSGMQDPVEVVMFTQKMECDHCQVTHELLEELTALSDKLTLTVHDFVDESDLAKTYGVDKIPGVVLKNSVEHGVRFFGVPGGYEFATLLEGILDMSNNTHGLSERVLAQLQKVDQPVHMQVMITPT